MACWQRVKRLIWLQRITRAYLKGLGMYRISRLWSEIEFVIWPSARQTPSCRLYRILSRHPCQDAACDAVLWAQRCLDNAAVLISCPCRSGAAGAGDAQAVKAYELALAAGFYQIEAQMDPTPLLPAPGSCWTAGQLGILQSLGMEHGRYVRLNGASGFRERDTAAAIALRRHPCTD